MAEVIRQRNEPSVISWLALTIAIVAMVISVMAFNRSGQNIDDSVRESINEAAGSVEQATDNP